MMQRPLPSFFIEDLVGSKIVTAQGKRLGHVVDVEVAPGPKPKVTTLIFGRYAWLYRFHAVQALVDNFGIRHEPFSVPWEAVERYDHFTVRLKPGYEPARHPPHIH